LATHAKTAKQQLGGRRGGVEPGLLVAQDPDPGAAELLDRADHRPDPFPRKSVERPYEEHVELPPMRGGQQLAEPGAIRAGAAGGLGVDGDDLEAEARGPRAQLALLVLDGLLSGRDPDVDGGGAGGHAATTLLPNRPTPRHTKEHLAHPGFSVWRGLRAR
jgi:hypothetical protein